MNNLGNAIALSADAQTLWEAADDAALLVELNRPQLIQRTHGDVSIAGMAAWLSPDIAARFVASIRGVVATLRQGDLLQQGQADLFDAFMNRFVANEDGLDFTNELLRTNISQMLTTAGWTVPEIAAVLDLGYTLRSPAVHIFNRSVQQSDIDAFRTWTVQEKVRNDYQQAIAAIQPSYDAGDRVALVAVLRTIADTIEAG